MVASLDLLILSKPSFVKTVKIIPLSFSGMNWLLFNYTLVKHLQPDQKLYLLYDGRRNKYQSGEVFEAAFYFERMKLNLLLELVCFVTYFLMKNCVKTINEISSEGVKSIWSKCLSRLRSKLLIAFLIGVTIFLAFLKRPIEQPNGWPGETFLI